MLSDAILNLPLSNGIPIKEYLFDTKIEQAFEKIVVEQQRYANCDEITAAKFAISCYEKVISDFFEFIRGKNV
jgi:hypothetical protein